MTEEKLIMLPPAEAINRATSVDNTADWKAIAKREDVRKFVNENPENEDVGKFLNKMPADIAYNFALDGSTYWGIWLIFLARPDVLECLN